MDPMVALPHTEDLTLPELRRLVRDLAARPEQWEHLVRHDPAERVYRELLIDEHVGVYLICWMEGHDTGFHDHDVSAAAISVAYGQVLEERLAIGAEPASCLLGPGDVLDVAPEDIHRVTHAGSLPAVTIHAYSPPLSRMGAYEVSPAGQLRRYAMPHSEELRPVAATV
jgi:predicted metal-dependent enzyme (double-stranded beta helix superfamily)